jgi:LPXTG-site transpeptidase (sortase) family protein
MKMKPLGRIVAILSATSMAAGIAIISFAGVQIQISKIAVENLYTPSVAVDTEPSLGISDADVVLSGSYLGLMKIPSIKRSVNIFQGTDSKTLKKGAGHYLQSVMPGVQDNSVIAGHRDTVFSNLGKVKIGAYVFIALKNETFLYQVDRIRIVDKDDRTVIVPTDEARLTLSTCYPFRYIGNAPKRYVVIATLIPKEDDAI